MKNKQYLSPALLVLALAAVRPAHADSQNILENSKEISRGALINEKNLLDAQIEVAKKRAELNKYNETNKPADHSKDVPINAITEEKIILIGVRGLNGHLTADLRVGGMPLTLKVGEQYDNLKLRNLTPVCATIARSGIEKKFCLSALPQTVSAPPTKTTASPYMSTMPVQNQSMPEPYPGIGQPMQPQTSGTEQ